MIKLKQLEMSIHSIRQRHDGLLWFMRIRDDEFIIECCYNVDNTQIRVHERLRTYSRYTPQFEEIFKKMEKIIKVLGEVSEEYI